MCQNSEESAVGDCSFPACEFTQLELFVLHPYYRAVAPAHTHLRSSYTI